MKILFATGNQNKLREAQEILGNKYQIETPEDYGITEDIPETADTLKGNAIQKAEYIWNKTGLSCFADDTGLEIDFLEGAPGVYSARYAGEEKSSEDNIVKVLNNMQNVPAGLARAARFKCAIALIIEGEVTTFDGIVEGEITLNPVEGGGFGYDPIFKAAGHNKCFSELSPDEKNTISHRGKAMRLLADHLKNI